MSPTFQKFRHIFIPFSILLVFLLIFGPTTIFARPSHDEVSNMADAIRYLESLEKYYSQVARPRFGRSLNRNFGTRSDVEPRIYGMLSDPSDEIRR
uniref:NPF n=1 Tax=Limulus polyphemus TaxID=6850 RepID=A0A1B0Z1Q5_LIMPO|nr:NPF [Limulus polyphemus]